MKLSATLPHASLPATGLAVQVAGDFSPWPPPSRSAKPGVFRRDTTRQCLCLPANCPHFPAVRCSLGRRSANSTFPKAALRSPRFFLNNSLRQKV